MTWLVSWIRLFSTVRLHQHFKYAWLTPLQTEILKPSQFRHLMEAAREYDGGSMLAYFAVCIFAGVRPAEARRLTWDDIDSEKGHIYVSPVNSKTRADRYVDMGEVESGRFTAHPARATADHTAHELQFTLARGL